MSSIELVLKTTLSILASVAIFLVGAMFVLMYVLVTATVAVTYWCRDVWRRAVIRPRNRVAATAPSALMVAPRATTH